MAQFYKGEGAMRQFWILQALILVVIAGCNPSPQQESRIMSGFAPKAVIEGSLPENATFIGVGESKETVTLNGRVFHYRELRATCLVAPSVGNEFMQAFEAQIGKMLQDAETKVQGRLIREGRSDSTLSEFMFGYTIGRVSGFVSVRGGRGQEERYTLLVTIYEGWT
jgi:hypothetical protein